MIITNVNVYKVYVYCSVHMSPDFENKFIDSTEFLASSAVGSGINITRDYRVISQRHETGAAKLQYNIAMRSIPQSHPTY